MINQKAKAFKVFNPDWTCRSYQFEVGKSYEHQGELKPCRKGFHACFKAADCFSYYDFNPNNKVAEVEVEDYILHDFDSKVTARKIMIIRELTWQEVLTLVNLGRENTGIKNTGNCNAGSRNTGDYNSGHYNTGNYNLGLYNAGAHNSGHYNSGHCNSGHRNSGHYNSGINNNGLFNEDEPTIKCFGKETGLKLSQITTLPIANLIFFEEKDGRKVNYSYKEAWINYWATISDITKEAWKSLPNFDPIVFERITGIKVS